MGRQKRYFRSDIQFRRLLVLGEVQHHQMLRTNENPAVSSQRWHRLEGAGSPTADKKPCLHAGRSTPMGWHSCHVTSLSVVKHQIVLALRGRNQTAVNWAGLAKAKPTKKNDEQKKVPRVFCNIWLVPTDPLSSHVRCLCVIRGTVVVRITTSVTTGWKEDSRWMQKKSLLQQLQVQNPISSKWF